MPARVPCKNYPACKRSVRVAECLSGYCVDCLHVNQRKEKLQRQAAAASAALQSPNDPRPDQTLITDLRRKLTAAESLIEQQKVELGVLDRMREGVDNSLQIHPREGSGTSEATPVIMASDWHVEELVTSAQTFGKNVFNEEVAHKRIERFFQASTKLMKEHLNPGVTIHDVVVFLGGDFITNDIHEELVENVWCGPTNAIVWVQNRLIAGINYYLEHTPYTYTFVCRVGNHSRTTKKVHFSKENEHSLEYLLYVMLTGWFRNEPRVRFVLQDGYHIYFDVYDTTIRFHHGHAINYYGGIGGITIPVTKAIAGWDKARPADLDVFGHFHTTCGNNKFKCNGSLIGYNSFGVRIKADYEPPRQTLFLVDKSRGVTCDWPILLEV